jgi:hypothetical protein
VAPRPAQKKKTKRVSLLTAIDPKNIIDMMDTEDAPSAPDTPPTSSVHASSYFFRNRRAAQGKLMYDVKYHPMDDSIRPTQAAKRRSAHGEVGLFSADDSTEAPVHDDSNSDGGSDTKQEEQKSESTQKGKKRARSPSQSLEPTRRSSRRTATPRISYNMSIHPQDRDLEESSTDDSDEEGTAPRHKRKIASRSLPTKSRSCQRDANTSATHGRTGVCSPMVISSESADIDDDEPTGYHIASCEPDEDTSLVEEHGRSCIHLSFQPKTTLVDWYVIVLTA